MPDDVNVSFLLGPTDRELTLVAKGPKAGAPWRAGVVARLCRIMEMMEDVYPHMCMFIVELGDAAALVPHPNNLNYSWHCVAVTSALSGWEK